METGRDRRRNVMVLGIVGMMMVLYYLDMLAAVVLLVSVIAGSIAALGILWEVQGIKERVRRGLGWILRRTGLHEGG